MNVHSLAGQRNGTVVDSQQERLAWYPKEAYPLDDEDEGDPTHANTWIHMQGCSVSAAHVVGMEICFPHLI